MTMEPDDFRPTWRSIAWMQRGFMLVLGAVAGIMVGEGHHGIAAVMLFSIAILLWDHHQLVANRRPSPLAWWSLVSGLYAVLFAGDAASMVGAARWVTIGSAVVFTLLAALMFRLSVVWGRRRRQLEEWRRQFEQGR